MDITGSIDWLAECFPNITLLSVISSPDKMGSHVLKRNLPFTATLRQDNQEALPVPSAGWLSPAPPPWSLGPPPWRSRPPSRCTGPCAASRRCSSDRWLCGGRINHEARWGFLRTGCFAARLEENDADVRRPTLKWAQIKWLIVLCGAAAAL